MPTAHFTIEKYCSAMEEVKLRTSVIDSFLTGPGHALYEPSTLETVGLQFRKILELIAFGSLIANQDEYSKVYRDFAKHWNAGDLVKNLESINPNFYPFPVVEMPSTDPNVKAKLEQRSADYLKKDAFVEVYGRCGVLMHAANPFGKGTKYEYYRTNLPA